MKKRDKIFVTQPSLPPLDDFIKSVEEIWESKWITNNGRFHQEFEQKLAEHLGVNYISLFSNGTLALVTAIQALQLEGEIITTPYSFVATAHAIWWNKIRPVFVDVDPVYGNLDPEKIEAAITDKTTAILPVHVYGNPCQHDKIQAIAKKHNLKLIYDGAHAFGVDKSKNSVLNYGDLSILSFHATKTFNTVEGGAIISHTAEMKQHIDRLKNFGFVNEVTVLEPGINGKMNELQAAYGLLQLKEIDQKIAERKTIAHRYMQELKSTAGISFIEDQESVKHNYSYFPIFVNEEEYGSSRDELYEKLKANDIFGRRYFYPLITDFAPYSDVIRHDLSNANRLAQQVICLPIYPDLKEEDVLRIIDVVCGED